MDFEAYYKFLGFESYPFSIYNSEGETDKGESIYKKPQNYSIIREGLTNSSVIITGERGTGKTALNLDVCRSMETDDILLVKIDEFSNLEQQFDPENLYKFLTEAIAGAFFARMSSTPNKFWTYSKEERVDLSMYLHTFVRASSKALLTEKIKDIQNSRFKKIAIGLYNFIRVALNYGLKAATKVTSDALTKHFSSLPEIDLGDSEYFGRIESEVDESFTVDEKGYFYLNKLSKLILKSDINDIVIIIDKIDEDPRFNNDADLISKFIEGIASNNKVMINDNFKIMLFAWTTPFNFVKSNIRTQKLILQPLSWDHQSLKEAANKRIKVYSQNRISSIEDIFEPECAQEILSLYDMSNENPRDLWHLLDKSIKLQFEADSEKKITYQAIENGIREFVTNFNYYEYYPRKSNARANTMDIYSYIKHLLKLDDVKFTKDKLSNYAQTGGSTNNYVVAMENMGLIRKTNEKSAGGGVIYEIRDPKVRYALRNGLDIDK